MKTFIQIVFVLLPYYFAASIPTVREKLENINSFWRTQTGRDIDFSQIKIISNEVELIQTHLFLIEKTLRNKPATELSKKQFANRTMCLDLSTLR